MAIPGDDDYSLVMAMECENMDNLPEPWPAVEPGRIVPGLPQMLTRERARLWALVLDARGVPCCLEQPEPARWEIRVPRERIGQAMEESPGRTSSGSSPAMKRTASRSTS